MMGLTGMEGGAVLLVDEDTQLLTLVAERNLPQAVKELIERDPFLLETGVPGILAAGDVRQGAIPRVAAAVGQGGMVVSFVHQYLNTV